jgi:hypothetical protein
MQSGGISAPPYCNKLLSRHERWIFPVAVLGKLSINSIQRGYFQGPMARYANLELFKARGYHRFPGGP